MEQLEVEDLTHRYSQTYVRVKANKPKVVLFNSVNSEGRVSASDPFLDKAEVFDLSSVDLISPNSRYIQYGNQALYVAKTGDRYFKKGFSLNKWGDKYMYKIYNPLSCRLKILEVLSEDLLIENYKKTLIEGCGDSVIEHEIAYQMYYPRHTVLQAMFEIFCNKGTSFFSVSLSDKIAVGLSSHSSYDLELYYELFSIGFISLKNQIIYIYPEFKQEIQDFLALQKGHGYELCIL